MKQIIKRPVVTEKATKLGEQRQYAFEVDINANKIEIKKALEEMFEVNITSLRTVRQKGKNKTQMTRKGLMRGKTADRKKAYITLKVGQSIDVVSDVATA
ncbi:MAG: 50S ribosomal protein L23 [Ignavibacteria bacterium]|jgi:large subunit ribosomal protein L23|nr:50S ribosomal protein L23 [Ignavibacteria bacterium]